MPAADTNAIAVEKPTRTRYWVVAYALILVVILYIDRVCIGQAAPAIRRELGLSTVETGYVFSAFGLAYTLFEIPGGWLADSLGPRKMLARIVIWWSFFTAATGLAWNLTSLVITRFLFGMGEAGCFPTLAKAFTAWLASRERPLATALLQTCANVGGAAAPLVVQLMLEHMSWRQTFGCLGAIGLFWVIPFYRWYKDDPREHKGVNARELSILPPPDIHLAEAGGVPWRTLLSSRTVWLLCLQWFCFDYGFYFYLTWFPTYLQEGAGFDSHTSAILAGLPLLVGGAGPILSARLEPVLARRFGGISKSRRVLGCFSFAATSALLLWFASVPHPRWEIALLILSCFTGLFCQPISWACCMDIGGKSVGTLTGVMNTAGQLAGATVSPTVVGWILQLTNHNWTPVFLVSAAVSVMGVACWLFIDSATPITAHEAASD
jgi:MFS family permease